MTAAMWKYAGVGSKKTPYQVCKELTVIGEFLADAGWLLRSGGAEGADQAFEDGCINANGLREIYRPWCPRFNHGTDHQFCKPTKEAFELAATIHPNWSAPKMLMNNEAGRKLHARNCHQVLGYWLDDPVDVVICWTQGGAITGGTATAIKLAMSRGIRVVNLATEKWDATHLLGLRKDRDA